tara:strand:+ start:8318 stop:9682 length:1365 start_codon:yes stop_codon:yes gene_type:complete
MSGHFLLSATQESQVKIVQDDVVERQTKLHIELEDEDLEPYLDRAYKRVVQRVNIPGFRKGKAPRSIVEQMFGRESLINDSLDSMLPELTGKAIDDQQLDAVGMPSIELEELTPLQFSAIVPLQPEVDLGAYTSIRVEKELPTLDDDAVNQRIEQLRLSVASWEPADRPVEMGDMVSAQIQGEIDGKTTFDEKDAVYLVNEEIARPFPGFSEKLVGLSVNNPEEFDLDIPEDFPDQNLAGKTSTFKVIISDVKSRVLPELDDEFAQSIGEGYEDLEDLKSQITESMQSEAETESTRTYRDSLIEALVETATLEIPPLLLKNESDHMIQEQERMVSQANMVLDDYLQSIGKTREELEEESIKEAETRLTRSFVLSKLAETEEIEVTDADVEEKIKEMFANAEQEFPESSQSEEMKNYLKSNLRMEKTMERLESIASGTNETEEVIDEKEGEADAS